MTGQQLLVELLGMTPAQLDKPVFFAQEDTSIALDAAHYCFGNHVIFVTSY